jgi:hypothetical protein
MWGVLSHFTEYRVKNSVDEARRFSATERLRVLNRLIDRAFRGDRRVGLDRIPMQHLDQRNAHDAPLKRSDSRRTPAMRMALDQRVEILREIGGSMRQRPCQLGRIRRKRLRQRAAGEVMLIERDDRSAPLLAAPHPAGLGPRDVVAGAGVDADLVADVDKQRHLHMGARLERRRLGPSP